MSKEFLVMCALVLGLSVPLVQVVGNSVQHVASTLFQTDRADFSAKFLHVGD